jgi:hypothetical protein
MGVEVFEVLVGLGLVQAALEMVQQVAVGAGLALEGGALDFGGLKFGREIADGAIVYVLEFILGCLLALARNFEVIGPPAACGKGSKVMIGFGGRGYRSRLKYRIRIAQLTRIRLGIRLVQERL